MEPNLPGLIGSILSKTSINDVNEHLQRVRDAGDSGRRVGIYSLCAKIRKPKTASDLRAFKAFDCG